MVNRLTKDNIDNLSKSWLVQKQTAFGKDKSNPLTAYGLLKIIWLSFVPKFLLELKQLATPEVMALLVKRQKPLNFSQKIARD